MNGLLTGLLVGIGVGLLIGEILIAIGAPFVTAHAMLGAGAIIGAVVGYGKGRSEAQ